MREILFRGQYDKDMWIEGNPIVTNDGTFIYFGNGHAYWNNAEQCMQVENLLKVEPETVGQFTGLLDMNGKKIFEGDIIDDDRELYAVVTYFESISSFLAQSGSTTWNLNEGNPNRDCKLQYTEVVGNIHDNPELLEVK